MTHPGEIVWYATGWFYAAADGSLRDAGYFLQLQGIDDSLFGGAPGEGTAHLTFLADPFRAADLRNGDLALGKGAVGNFAVYFHAEPSAGFGDPASFGAGEEVARFRRVAVVTGPTDGTASGDLFSLIGFSAQLVSSRPFQLRGRRYDLGRLLPSGITQWGTTAWTAAPDVPGYTSVIPFVGGAVATGGAPPPPPPSPPR